MIASAYTVYYRSLIDSFIDMGYFTGITGVSVPVEVVVAAWQIWGLFI